MEKNKNYRSDFLFTIPSFLIGMGSVLNVAGNYFPFNYAKNDKHADGKAIASDWGVVGNDIETASFDIQEKLTTTNG